MVIGPNGTGKNLDEFVKHGAKRGQIEIELAADPERHDSNPVITTKTDKGDTGNASEYLINGKKANKKRVQELAQSFSIQVDNLCQFLPQDKVVEFAALSPVELLSSTQRAAAPQQMSDWYEQLKEWRK
ncbi:Structural maintenance of chromosomes protein 5 [Vermiconidia calcicola]|uniref:Structural maintenance of chromosomes protein 5 n=1 Tax=Vermiconidia calcicola TaxID=1690605 RepID=A0ACC3MNR4_9PEZI|nr:Structural maintenance of chromosomes protein 5 [Vermiconidia calcicola]